MSDRPRSEPPKLTNFVYEKWLGGGGFADVFLYQQIKPARKVAIKVLRAEGLPPEARAAFDDEGDLMAKVSEHPYIVSIYEADVAPDGRPYLVMQYYPNPHYGERAKPRGREPGGLAVAEVLSVGVRIASAVETAHQAKILHRDIKPANILVSEYNRPGLTDFGIAGTREGGSSEPQGVTYAYAPPEILASDVPGDERADVYSLAATLYALLAGRAPFEVPHGDNSTRAIASRTLNDPIPAIGRVGVPMSLELLLQQGMAKRPGDRPATAAALARALQAIEQELRLAPTEFEVAIVPVEPQAPASPQPELDGDATRSGKLQVVRPDAPPPAVVPVPVPMGEAVADRPLHVPEAPPVEDTVTREKILPPTPAEVPEAIGPGRKSRMGLVAAAALGVVLLAGAVAFAASGARSGSTSSTTTTVAGDEALVLPDAPLPPKGLTVQREDGAVMVSWSPVSPQANDVFLVARVDGAHAQSPATRSTDTWLRVAVAADEAPCFSVTTERGSRQSEPSLQECAP